MARGRRKLPKAGASRSSMRQSKRAGRKLSARTYRSPRGKK